MIKYFTYAALLTLFISCKGDDDTELDCSTVSCSSPVVAINLMDNTTNESFIIQNNITQDDITILDSSNNEVTFFINPSNGFLFADKYSPNGNYNLQIGSDIVINISFDTIYREVETCCYFGHLIDVDVEDKIFEVENEILINVYL